MTPLKVLGGESSDSSWWPGILAGAWLQAVALRFCFYCTLSGLPSEVSSASNFLFDFRIADIGFGDDSNPIRPWANWITSVQLLFASEGPFTGFKRTRSLGETLT